MASDAMRPVRYPHVSFVLLGSVGILSLCGCPFGGTGGRKLTGLHRPGMIVVERIDRLTRPVMRSQTWYVA